MSRLPHPGVPPRDSLPRWLAPLPKAIEDLGLRFVWLVVAINLVGTAFGFWYYLPQFAETPPVMWIFVPDSPVATLCIAGAFALWAVGRENAYLTALAFFGNIKLGLWTPWVLVVFAESFLAFTAPAMYAFLLVSHLAMVLQAFVLHRITDFPLNAVALAVAWYTVDLTVDYFIPDCRRSTPHGDSSRRRGRVSGVDDGVPAGRVGGGRVDTRAAVLGRLGTRIRTLKSTDR